MTIEEITSIDNLLQVIAGGLHPEYLYFWGHRPLPNGEIGKSCFSQWWPAPFTVAGVTFPTAEHYMMAEKARLFDDEEVRAKILEAETPNDAKQLGRQIRNFNQQIWEDARFRLVVEGNRAKFSQNRELGEFLLATDDRVLVEASPVDPIWGIGLAADDERAKNPEQWRGLNLLGFALIDVRRQLRELEFQQ